MTDITWRSTNQVQRERNRSLLIATRSEKIEFLIWAKDFYNNCFRKNKLPENMVSKSLADGYIMDMSEVGRLRSEENIHINWTPIPYGFSQEQWDNPELLVDSTIGKDETYCRVS
jgi:hypothetical protein